MKHLEWSDPDGDVVLVKNDADAAAMIKHFVDAKSPIILTVKLSAARAVKLG